MLLPLLRVMKHLFEEGNPGRPKGSKNRFTMLREDFLQAFHNLGGIEGLVEWAQRDDANLRDFYKIIASLLPKPVEVTGEDGQALVIRIDSNVGKPNA